MIEHVVDLTSLLESLDNDEQILADIVRTYLADTPRLVAAVRAAVSTRDTNQIVKASHALKGSVSVFGAARAVERAQALESLGHQGTMEGVGDALAGLEREVALVTTALEKVLKGAG